MEINCLKAPELIRGDSLLCTTKSPGVSGTHLIHLGRMKGNSTLEPPSDFETSTPRSGNQHLNHEAIDPSSMYHVSTNPSYATGPFNTP